MLESYFLLWTVICILTVAVIPYSSDIFSVGAYYVLYSIHEISLLWIPKL